MRNTISSPSPTTGQPLSQSELATLVGLGHAGDQSPPGADFLPSPERVEREVAGMMHKQLSPALAEWVEGYARVGRRNPYLWTWCRQAVEVTTLPCVAPELRDELCDTKALGVMLDVMLDDVADRRGNGGLLEDLLDLVENPAAWPDLPELPPTAVRREPDFSCFPEQDRKYARFTADVWREILARAERYPRFHEFAPILRYDYLQLCNVMRYSHLLNGNLELLNLAEHDLYTPHNMHIMICSTFDLMCSPGFDRSDLGLLREMVWNAQCMGRIGNLVTTWERELGEGDFTSGVYARAVSEGDLRVEQLQSGDREGIAAAITDGGHEAYFLDRWRRHRDFLLSRRDRMRSFDVAQLVTGFERLICLHLGSRGRK